MKWSNFMEIRGKVNTFFKEFASLYKKHIKKNRGNDTTWKKMEMMLIPLLAVLDTNMRLGLIDFQFQDLDAFDVNNFKYKALIIKFCTAYQKLQKLLLTHNIHNPDYKPEKDDKKKPKKEEEKKEPRWELIYHDSPDIYSVLKKFQYEGWREVPVESFFIQQLLDSFMKMRVNMSKLCSMGPEYWKIPISANEQLMMDITELVNLENEIEVILGDRLKREQLNFMYDVLKVIYDGRSRKKLLKKREKDKPWRDKMMTLSIPRLVALKSLEQINNIFQRKYIEVAEGEPYHQHEIEPPKKLLDFALMSAINPREVKTHQSLLPQGHKYQEDIHLANDKNYLIEMDDNNLDELDKYGRFFIWPDYIPEEMHDEICQNAKRLRDINIAVLHDLEDYMIVEGMEASHYEMHRDKENALKENRELNDQQKLEMMNDIFKNRPPHLWNEPESLESHHFLRTSAKPFNVYKDGRVKELYGFIAKFGDMLKNHEPKRWRNLVEQTVRVFADMNTRDGPPL
jgi:hypothetical protein